MRIDLKRKACNFNSLKQTWLIIKKRSSLPISFLQLMNTVFVYNNTKKHIVKLQQQQQKKKGVYLFTFLEIVSAQSE